MDELRAIDSFASANHEQYAPHLPLRPSKRGKASTFASKSSLSVMMMMVALRPSLWLELRQLCVRLCARKMC